MKIKQIRKKPLLHQYKTNRFNALINNYVYKHIIFITLLKKYYLKNKFDIFEELKKQNYFYYFSEMLEYHKENIFYKEKINQILTYYYNYITDNIKNIELDKFYFIAYMYLVETIPIKKVVSEWNYPNITALESEYLTKNNIKDIKNLLSFKLNNLPIPNFLPLFEYKGFDIKYDNYIIEIVTKNQIGYVPSVKKVLNNKNYNNEKIIVINPRFEFLTFFEKD